MTNPQPQPRLVGRDRLATKLREIRAQGGRSVRVFGDVVGMATSKVSRLENGHQMPTAAEIDQWISGATVDDADREALRADLHDLRDDALTERSLNRRRFKDGQAPIQAEFNDLSAGASTIRTFQPALIPSLLQTPDYARAVLATVPKVIDTIDDIDAAVATRMKRGELLQDPARTFEFIVWEPALLRRFGSEATMRGQLFHLSAAIGLPNIRIGVIPSRSTAVVPSLSSVILYDDFAVVETVVDDPRYSGQDAQILHRYIDMLWNEAVEGDEARRLIRAASETAGI